MKPELLKKALSYIQNGQISALIDEEIETLLNFLISAQSVEEERTFSGFINALLKEKQRRTETHDIKATKLSSHI